MNICCTANLNGLRTQKYGLTQKSWSVKKFAVQPCRLDKYKVCQCKVSRYRHSSTYMAYTIENLGCESPLQKVKKILFFCLFSNSPHCPIDIDNLWLLMNWVWSSVWKLKRNKLLEMWKNNTEQFLFHAYTFKLCKRGSQHINCY